MRYIYFLGLLILIGCENNSERTFKPSQLDSIRVEYLLLEDKLRKCEEQMPKTDTTTKAVYQIANFSEGELFSPEFKVLSFWIKDGQIDGIYLRYGSNSTQVELKFKEASTIYNKKCFIMEFPASPTWSQTLFFVWTENDSLIVQEENGNAHTYTWHYEGPMDGRGMPCDWCAQDGKEAVEMVKKYFIVAHEAEC